MFVFVRVRSTDSLSLSVDSRRIPCFRLFRVNRSLVSCSLIFFYCTENIKTTQRDTVRLHPSISFLFLLCPTAGKREHRNLKTIFVVNTGKKGCCLFLFCLRFLVLFINVCLCPSDWFVLQNKSGENLSLALFQNFHEGVFLPIVADNNNFISNTRAHEFIWWAGKSVNIVHVKQQE